jgi:hypothetical protein
VLARLVEARSDTGDFTGSGIDELFHELRLPAPSKVSNVLAQLERKALIRRGRDRGLWRVTPEGQAAVEEIMTGVELATLAAEASVGGTQLGGAQHAVILPEMGAPPGLLPVLRTFLQEHPFDTNVFGMTRFPDEERDEDIDPVGPALDVAREVCAAHGLEFHLASDRAMDDDLWTNIAAHMWASKYGIAFFEDMAEPKRGINYNLTIEVGGMLVAGRRTAMLKDESIATMPTDLVGKIYKPIKITKPVTVAKVLHKWIRDDLNLGACAKCPAK